MGAAIGACLVATGREVLWSAAGRSAATRARAEKAGLQEVSDLAELVAGCQVIFSVCPPSAALTVAADVAALGFTGTYVEANAVAPATTTAVAGRLQTAQVVDGGIIGGPPTRGGTTRLYLSGPGADGVAVLFDGSPLEVVVCGQDLGRASAIKLSFAAWTKGSAALRLTVVDLAAAAGVADDLASLWEWSDPALLRDLASARGRAAARGWRWAGEMEEVAAMAGELGIAAGFWEAAATRYRREQRIAE
jgi:3-hydroxyisobutyrate dehydrogenase-like beta-hydroxyacid dehydrogenase